MSELKKLTAIDSVSLAICVPSSDQRGKDAVRILLRPDQFTKSMGDWIRNGRSMTNFGGVAPMIVGMFAVCAM